MATTREGAIEVTVCVFHVRAVSQPCYLRISAAYVLNDNEPLRSGDRNCGKLCICGKL